MSFWVINLGDARARALAVELPPMCVCVCVCVRVCVFVCVIFFACVHT